MASQTGRDTAQPAPTRNAPGRQASRTPLWIGAAALVGFLLGFGWQYPRAERARAVATYASRALREILGQRDAIITALARSDPASASVLAQALTRYRGAMRQAGLDSAVAPSPVR